MCLCSFISVGLGHKDVLCVDAEDSTVQYSTGAKCLKWRREGDLMLITATMRFSSSMHMHRLYSA